MLLHFDGLNTISEITDQHGDVIEQYRYDAFGNIMWDPSGNVPSWVGDGYHSESGSDSNSSWFKEWTLYSRDTSYSSQRLVSETKSADNRSYYQTLTQSKYETWTYIHEWNKTIYKQQEDGSWITIDEQWGSSVKTYRDNTVYTWIKKVPAKDRAEENRKRMANETGTPPPNAVALYNVGSLDGTNIFLNALTSEASYNSLNNDQQEILLDALIKNKIIAEEIPYYLKKEIDKRELTLGRPLPMFEEDESERELTLGKPLPMFEEDESINIDEKIAELTAGLKEVNDIALAQAYLVLMGFDLGNYGPNKNGVDGEYGDITWSAIKAFQKYYGLEQTGIVDQLILDKLKEAALNGITVHDIADVAFLWPTKTYGINSYFGYRINEGELEFHKGIDIAPKEWREDGDPITASIGGIVEYAGWDPKGGGYMIRIVTEIDGVVYHTRYMHLQEGKLKVKTGDTVVTGQPIASMGSTGRSSGTHLHFQINVNGEPIDPMSVVYYKKE